LVDLNLVPVVGTDVARQAEVYITADAQGGVLPAMLANRSYCVLCGHWGRLLDNGSAVYREVFSRLQRHHPGEFQWLTCSALARYYAVARTFRPVQRKDGTWCLESATPCPEFTVSFRATAAVRRLLVDGTELKRDDGGVRRLGKGCWRQQGESVCACFDLGTTAALKVDF
jgi:hypothetical protein